MNPIEPDRSIDQTYRREFHSFIQSSIDLIDKSHSIEDEPDRTRSIDRSNLEFHEFHSFTIHAVDESRFRGFSAAIGRDVRVMLTRIEYDTLGGHRRARVWTEISIKAA